MASLNSVHLIGILAKEPDFRSGAYELTLDTTRLEPAAAIANDELRPVGGDARIVTDRHRVLVRGASLFESVAALKRGTRLFVSGQLESRPLYDEHGVVHQIAEVVAVRIEALRQGLRQDVFNALRLRQQRQRDSEAFIAAAVIANDQERKNSSNCS